MLVPCQGGRGGNLLVGDGLVDEEGQASSFDVISTVLSLESVVGGSLGFCLRGKLCLLDGGDVDVVSFHVVKELLVFSLDAV